MVLFARIFAFINCIVLAAHFYRSGDLILAAIPTAAALLTLIRRPWSRLVLQLVLGLGVLEWTRTMVEFVTLRQELGMPYVRLQIILGGVAFLCGVAAGLLSLPAVVDAFRHRGQSEGNFENSRVSAA